MNERNIEKLKKLQELKEKVEALRKLYKPIEPIIMHATAIIIEPRQHKALSFVLKNILENLDANWAIQIYHGNNNREFVQEIVENELLIYTSRITLINLGVENLTSNQYSKIMLDRKFIEGIPTETFLVFQTDSMINPRYKDLIYTFLKYEYVGAPWTNGMVGNGGFSLRRKSKSLKCITENILSTNEDLWYSLPVHGLYKPPCELASLFSIETVYSKVFFAVHNAWKYHSPAIVDEMCENCPGLSKLIKLQGVFD